jgi:hypothetical protein
MPTLCLINLYFSFVHSLSFYIEYKIQCTIFHHKLNGPCLKFIIGNWNEWNTSWILWRLSIMWSPYLFLIWPSFRSFDLYIFNNNFLLIFGDIGGLFQVWQCCLISSANVWTPFWPPVYTMKKSDVIHLCVLRWHRYIQWPTRPCEIFYDTFKTIHNTAYFIFT